MVWIGMYDYLLIGTRITLLLLLDIAAARPLLHCRRVDVYSDVVTFSYSDFNVPTNFWLSFLVGPAP